jgi:hypothetical protein
MVLMMQVLAATLRATVSVSVVCSQPERQRRRRNKVNQENQWFAV